ncbi:hypothetical protein DRW07_00705 [Alteromonas sediminis]|uniref:TonB-dependent receptor n=1 Tax=Alteromonas sediminis TaxID=2259342 RepID=A0A3N5Y2A0_9ALTE|nr:hypothetical protein [Alteromonas sediminis]RPJ67967.1 hypothetical protein DRW07_00705 [Alteromonas sediminis]
MFFLFDKLPLLRSENGEEQRNVNLSANKSSKLGVSYEGNNWQLSVYHLYYSRYHDSIIFDPNRELLNPDAEGFDWINIKATRKYGIGQGQQTVGISFELKNLLDEQVYLLNDTPVFYPINTLPARQSRGVYVTASLSF